MLNQLENLAKCVAGNNEFIDQWLQTRKGLLVAYYHLIGLKPCKKKSILPWTKKRWTPFAISWWIISPPVISTFTIDRIVPEGETTSALIYSALQENTQQIMALYDSHLESAIDHDNYLAFQEALSGVGEALANHFILDDKLIQQAQEYSVQAASTLPAANSTDIACPAWPESLR